MSAELFVTCPETLELLLAEELKEMGIENVNVSFRGVYVPLSMKNMYDINYMSRIAGRVLYPITSFSCYDKEDLYAKAKKIDWSKFLTNDKTFAIDVNGKHRAFSNTLFAAQVLKDALCDQFRDKTGKRPNVQLQSPDVQLSLYLENDNVSISFDTSGDPLFKRGYRKEVVTAPLQESYAAAFLRMARYTGNEILLDPCCGSGTILIEAALIASHTPPGYLRKKWGFFGLPEYSRTEWEAVKKEHDSKIRPIAPNRLFGYDISKDNVWVAIVNLRSSGFFDKIQVTKQDFMEATPEVLPNLVVCNPPHGGRLDTPERLQPLYRALGEFLKQKLAKPARAFVFTSSLELSKEVGLKPKQRHVIKLSGTDCRLLEYDLY